MSQTEQLCVNDVVEIDGLKSGGPWSNKIETLFVDLMRSKLNASTTFTKTSWNYMRSQLNAST